MAPDVRAIADISSAVGNYYDKLALERLTANVVLYPLLEKRTIPAGSGNIINWNRWTNFPVSTLPLTEGEVPTQSYLSGTAVTSTIVQLGRWTAVSDLLEVTAFNPLMKDLVSNMGDNAGITVDTFIYQHMLSNNNLDESPASAQTGSTWFYGKSGGFSSLFISADGLIISSFGALYTIVSADATVTDGWTLDLDKVERMRTKLGSNNCHPFDDGFYKLYTHPKAIGQLRRTTEWQAINQYTRPEVLDKGLVAMYAGVKFYESTIPLDGNAVVRTSAMFPAGMSGIWNVIFGRGGMMVTELAGLGRPQIITKKTNQYDTSNPLNQWNTVGWKVSFAAKVVNPNCGYAFLTLTN
jgi:N4-gp56 family major capsid protein